MVSLFRPIYQRKNLTNSALEWVGQNLSNFSVGILFETMTSKRHFEINWPLIVGGMTSLLWISSVSTAFVSFLKLQFLLIWCILQGISHWTGHYELALTDRNMQVKSCLKVVLESWDYKFLIYILGFQKSNIGWPQQPLTEKVLIFNMIFYDYI